MLNLQSDKEKGGRVTPLAAWFNKLPESTERNHTVETA
jgi:hypothetical protein